VNQNSTFQTRCTLSYFVDDDYAENKQIFGR